MHARTAGTSRGDLLSVVEDVFGLLLSEASEVLEQDAQTGQKDAQVAWSAPVGVLAEDDAIGQRVHSDSIIGKLPPGREEHSRSE
jgi:hypothetical protein